MRRDVYRFSALLTLGAMACSGGDKGDTAQGTILPSIFVNEVMAANATGLQDEGGAFPDWVELYNADGKAVDIGGYWLTDSIGQIYKWNIPPGVTVPAHGYLVVFADSDPEQGDLHASFNLDQLGEQVALYGTDDMLNPLIDSMEYGVLAQDTSFARVPDGTDNWEVAFPATPEASN